LGVGTTVGTGIAEGWLTGDDRRVAADGDDVTDVAPQPPTPRASTAARADDHLELPRSRRFHGSSHTDVCIRHSVRDRRAILAVDHRTPSSGERHDLHIVGRTTCDDQEVVRRASDDVGLPFGS
jgi:hypothetical protein